MNKMETVFAALKIMGIGMGTIFIVMLAIMLLVVLLTKLTGKREKSE